MMHNLNIKTFFVFIATFSFLMMACSQAQAQGLPRDHSRWIGDVEGEAADKQGSALVYEFRFHVVVEVEDIEAARNGIAIEAPPAQDTSWGARIFQVRDPDGVPVTFLQWTRARSDLA